MRGSRSSMGGVSSGHSESGGSPWNSCASVSLVNMESQAGPGLLSESRWAGVRKEVGCGGQDGG